MAITETLIRAGTRQLNGNLTVSIRRLFAVLMAFCALLLAPMLLVPANESASRLWQVTALALMAFLCWRWLAWARGAKPRYVEILAEGLGICSVAVVVGSPMWALGIVYVAFYFRPLVGTKWWTVSGTLGSTIALLVGAELSGHPDYSATSADLLGQLPMFAMTALVGFVIAYVVRRADQAAAARLAAEARFRHLIERLPQAVFTASADGTLTYVSPQFEKIFGQKQVTFIGQSAFTLLDFVHPEDRERVGREGASALEGLDAFAREFRIEHPTGDVVWARIDTRPVYESGREAYYLGTMSDITEEKAAMGALAESERRFHALVDHASDGFFLISADGRIHDVNRRACEGLGYTREELLGFHIWEIHEPREMIYLEDLWEQLSNGQTATIEGIQRRKDDAEFPSEANVGLLELDGQVFLHALVRDVSDRKLLEEQIVHQAFHDSLTGLPNRALFRDRLEHAIMRSTRAPRALAVLFMDIDNFKIINDSLGHEAGDRYIRLVAERLRSAVRPGDTVARLGGDEFIVLMEDIERAELIVPIVERIQAELMAGVWLGEQLLHVGASIGVVHSPHPHHDGDELIRLADIAMYAAKRDGKGRYAFYEASMNDQAVERLAIETELRQAIQRDELMLHYQPIVDLASGAIVEVEALVRWNHPERGLLPPALFLPVAEEAGLMSTIDRWVLREACQQVRAWQLAHPSSEPLLASVNLSPSCLRDSTLVGEVQAILLETGLEPCYLRLEITEHAMVDDIELAKDVLSKLSALGVRLAVDDFGTGNSALNYLRQFPIDTLKIDRSFVTGLGLGGGDSAMVQGMISLSKLLGLVVTAEGVEGLEYVELREFGCERAQGFGFSEPVDAAGFEILLDRQSFPLRLPNLTNLKLPTRSGRDSSAIIDLHATAPAAHRYSS